MDIAAAKLDKLPPMLQQYLEYKHQYPDALLLFQVGDFYETFFEDAVTIARVLNLTLTSRDKHSADPIPMAGVPIAVVDGYLDRLVAAGFSAALVSQVGEASGRGMMARKLERIVTPGIRLLSPAEGRAVESFVAAAYPGAAGFEDADAASDFALAYASLQSGKVLVREGLGVRDLCAEIQRIAPAELLLPRGADRRQYWVRAVEKSLRGAPLKWRSEEGAAGRGTGRNYVHIKGYASISASAKSAVRLLVVYADEITVDRRLPITEIGPGLDAHAMVIDAVTRSALELVRNARDGSEAGSLFGVLNRTVTAGGGRMLRQWIQSPLCEIEAIQERLAAVGALLAQSAARGELQGLLKYMADLERLAARMELNAATPREMGALRDSLAKLPAIQLLLAQYFSADKLNAAGLLEQLSGRLESPREVGALLASSLSEAPPPHAKQGGIFAEGYREELDHLRGLRAKGRFWIAELEAEERRRTGINSLKIRYNNVQGFFIEVTKANAARVPDNYIRKQSMVGGERFVTDELRRMEQEVTGAEERQYELERELYEELKHKLLPFTGDLRRIAGAAAALDVLVCFASLAEDEGYVLPHIKDSGELSIVEGRHPVVAKFLRSGFVPNSLEIEDGGPNCAVVTGPNMGGKSTYLRQVGLIVIMAQMGSYIPAAQACIGVVDRIFARIGAADDLLEGDSTFMVEMREAANIVTSATSRSLLLVDEIGRGTATGDGLAIARAIIEWIIFKLKCRTLFATHFHQLTALEQIAPAVVNLSVGVVDDGEEPIFTHEIRKGPASKSYGLEVARLAGLPPGLITRAREIMREIESVDEAGTGSGVEQMPLFKPHVGRTPFIEDRQPPDYADLKALREKLQKVNLNEMTPLEALSWLSALQKDSGSAHAPIPK